MEVPYMLNHIGPIMRLLTLGALEIEKIYEKHEINKYNTTINDFKALINNAAKGDIDTQIKLVYIFIQWDNIKLDNGKTIYQELGIDKMQRIYSDIKYHFCSLAADS